MTDSDSPSIKLSHAGSEDVVIKFDYLDRKNEWIKHVVLLPWTTPTRLVGFVHPDAEKHIGNAPFTLFAAFSFYSQVMMQPQGKGVAVSEGPKLILPYEMMSPLDMHIGATCPSWVFLREQAQAVQELFTALLLQNILPKQIEEAPAPKIIGGR